MNANSRGSGSRSSGSSKRSSRIYQTEYSCVEREQIKEKYLVAIFFPCPSHSLPFVPPPLFDLTGFPHAVFHHAMSMLNKCFCSLTHLLASTIGQTSSPLPLTCHCLNKILRSLSQLPTCLDDLRSMDRAAKAGTTHMASTNRP